MRKMGFKSGVLTGSLLLIFGLSGTSQWASKTGRKATPAAKGISSLPLEAQAGISAALGRDLPAYRAVAAISDRRLDRAIKSVAAMSSSPVGGPLQGRLRPPLQGASFAMRNARNKLAADFTAQGVTVHSGTALWKMALAGYGYGNDLKSVAATVPTANANRVEYRRGELTEWYVNGPMGLEQGFTLSRRGASRCALYASASLRALQTGGGQAGRFANRPYVTGGPLTIALALSGDLTAKMDPNGKGLTLSGPSPSASPNTSPRPSLRYAGLTATDASGKELPASLELRGQDLLLKVNDAGARYPVVIDPFVQLAELTASDGANFDELGLSVAISGTTVVAGAQDNDTNAGAAYVFVEPASGWANMTQTAKLTASDAAPDAFLGCSVAISGNTVVAGARGASVGGNSDQGAAYVFVEPPTGWVDMTETAKVIASDGAKDDNLGASVAIAGGTVVVGASQEFSGPGAAYVFIQPPAGWKTTSRFKAKLTASDGVGGAELGASLGISGSTVVAGAPLVRAAYVFVRPATGWASMTQTAELTAPEQRSGDLGFSVAISGNTVVAGSPTASTMKKDSGAADVFVEPSSGWANMTPTAVLTAFEATEDLELGGSVAVSGNIVLATASKTRLGGTVYLFVEPKGGWSSMTQTGEIHASDEQSGDEFGSSVGIRGNTVVAGALGANANDGAVYVFGEVQ